MASTPPSNEAASMFPPPGTNWLAAIQPSLTFTMIGSIFSSMLIPIMIALFFFSTSNTRRQPIFMLNVFALALGIVEGVLNGAIEVHAILSPTYPSPPTAFIAYAFFSVMVPWVVEVILVCRILAVYPLSRISRRTMFMVYSFPIVVKIARIINLIMFMNQWIVLTRKASNPLVAGSLMWGSQPYTKIEWFLQLADNAYTSGVFIQRIQIHRRESKASLGTSFSTRLHSLFIISVSNFVFPCILSLGQLILLFRNPDFLLGSYVNMVNNFVNIIGVVFATVWSTGSSWASTVSGQTAETLSTFATATIGGTPNPRVYGVHFHEPGTRSGEPSNSPTFNAEDDAIPLSAIGKGVENPQSIHKTGTNAELEA